MNRVKVLQASQQTLETEDPSTANSCRAGKQQAYSAFLELPSSFFLAMASILENQ